MLDFRMETFLSVCRYMNFTHAAEALHLTQPAVSQHIRYLEQKYESPLFYREKKKLSLTPAGELLLSALETMQNDENTLKKRMQESLSKKKMIIFMTLSGCSNPLRTTTYLLFLKEAYASCPEGS